MALRQFSVRGLVVVLAAGLLAGCTPNEGPTATTSPIPTSASPTPTRTETAQEQKQREAFEAAEKAYRTNFGEASRLAMAGGASKPTQILLSTSTGSYLDATMVSLRGIKQLGLRATGPSEIAWIRQGGYSADKLVLKACEDFRAATLKKKNGDVYTPKGTRVYDQTITVVRSENLWRLKDEVTREVKQC